MSVCGQLEPFDPAWHNFARYAQSFKHFITGSGIEDGKKTAVFLTLIGYEAYNILANIHKESELKDLNDLIKELTAHYHPKMSIVAEATNKEN